MSWQEELRENITRADQLTPLLGLTREEEAQMARILDRYPMSITRYYLSLIQKDDPNDPIRRMCIPSLSETDLSGIAPGDVVQFANEEGKFVHTALITLVPLVRRYSTVLVAAHSNDSDCRPLDTYAFPVMRFIHIDGVRSCKDGNTEQPTDRNSPPSKFYRPVF